VATIDVDALREYLRDYYGTAMLAGLWPAVADLGELDALDGRAPRRWASTCSGSS